jgi:glycosyltransferase involved in cell wall biosynthesis
MLGLFSAGNSKLGADCEILAALRAPLENYPPSLNQVQLLAEAGHQVIVADVKPHDEAGHGLWTHPNVIRIRTKPLAIGASLLQRAEAAARYSFIVRRMIRLRRPRVVFAYDPYGMAAAGLSPAFNIWHFHELFDQDGDMGVLNRSAVRFANKNARHADIVIFPDADRGAAFIQETQHDASIEVVNNCPRRLEALPGDLLRPKLAEMAIKPSVPIVLFQGWIGPTRCIEQTVMSMPLWPPDAHFVLIGPVEQAYREKLTSLATEIGVSGRLVFLGRIPYQDLFAYTVGADIGLSIVTDRAGNGLNWKLSSGAINKRFEYMACGVPQVANKGPGMNELIESRGVGLLVDPESFQDIGKAIQTLLSDPSKLKQAASSARALHLDHFNYEQQFLPIVDKIVTICGSRHTSE